MEMEPKALLMNGRGLMDLGLMEVEAPKLFFKGKSSNHTPITKKYENLELHFFLFNFGVKWEKNIIYSCTPIVISNLFHNYPQK